MPNVRLRWVEELAKVAASESGSVILSTAEPCWPPSRGVSSSGTVGIVMVMRVRSVRDSCKEKTRKGRGGWEKMEKMELSVLEWG